MAKVDGITGVRLRRRAYRDRKRAWWLRSVFYPVMLLVGVALHRVNGHQIALGLPLLISFVAMPLRETLIGEDRNDPQKADVPRLEADIHYRWLTWATVPLQLVARVGCAWWAGTQGLSWWAMLMLAYISGLSSGLGINTGHDWVASTRPSNSGWLGSSWRYRPPDTSRSSTAVVITVGSRRRKITRGWVRASIALRCANRQAAFAAPGSWKGSPERTTALRLEHAQRDASKLRHDGGDPSGLGRCIRLGDAAISRHA